MKNCSMQIIISDFELLKYIKKRKDSYTNKEKDKGKKPLSFK